MEHMISSSVFCFVVGLFWFVCLLFYLWWVLFVLSRSVNELRSISSLYFFLEKGTQKHVFLTVQQQVLYAVIAISSCDTSGRLIILH